MKVCIVNEYFYPDSTGGTGTVLSSLAQFLSANYPDVELEVLTSHHLYRDAGAQLPAYENWNGIHIHRLPTPRPNGVSTPRRLLANASFSYASLLWLLRRPRFDVLLVGTAPPPLADAARWYKKMSGVPYVYVIYDLEPDRAIAMQMLSATNPVGNIIRRMQKRWLSDAHKAVVLGRCMQSHLGDAYGLPSEKVAVLPIGADPEEVFPMEKQTLFRKEQNLQGFVVLYSGNFGRYHDFDTILDAAKQLLPARPDVTFVLVGNGAQKEHIVSRVEGERLTNVRVLPFVAKENYADLLASANVSLVTLEPGMEGLCVPSKFYSILASGRATVAVMGSGSEVARVVSESQCGVQVGHGDVQSLVKTLAHLADHPEETEKMGQNARRVLLDRYTMNHIAAGYYSILAEATGTKTSAVIETARPTARSQKEVELRR